MKFMKLGSKPDSFQTNGKDVRFVATELATDMIVNVGDVTFYLHKFPLLSKSSLLQRLATSNDDENEEINISEIPGGPATFEICAKFCYGMIVTLNAYNVIATRCAAEYLEMHETTEKGNLIYKIEVFLNTSIFRSWKDSIIVLQTTKALFPWSEDLKLVTHCIDSVACKASTDASKVDWSYTYNRKKLPNENGIEPNLNGQQGHVRRQLVPKDWWVEDLCELELDFYKRVIVAIKSKGRVGNKIIGEALKAYTYRRLSGFAKGNVIAKGDNMKSRAILETVVRLMPEEKGSVSCNFLTRLLRTASILDCSETCKRDLIKRIGLQLEEASVQDMINVYDIDMVSSIVEEFVVKEKYELKKSAKNADDIEISPILVLDDSKMNVARLVDGYLFEVAKDRDLGLSKFLDLAEMLSGESRPVHDGRYRAIDMYLKEHPSLIKTERKKLCTLIDCKKLSPDACAHAVQNERLPLRTVVQVLFHEQSRESSKHDDTSGSGSYGSSRSAATTDTADETIQTTNSFKSMKLGASESSKNAGDCKANGKVKGINNMTPKKFLGKLLSNSGSDTSGSVDEIKATPSRKMRRSISRD